MSEASAKDLIVVVADADAREMFKSLLRRHQSLGIRPITFDVQRYVKRDSGCFRETEVFLRPFLGQYRFAIAAFDRDGSGQEQRSREDLESEVQSRLAGNGWADRSLAIVFDPELEAWVWSDSPEVDVALGWHGASPSLRQWLHGQNLLRAQVKPDDPKEAMRQALRKAGKAMSASLFGELAANVGLRRCSDPAFVKLKKCLRVWFPRA